MLTKVHLSKQTSIPYIKNELTKGAYISNVLANLPLEKGKAYTFLPNNIELDLIESYEQSIYLIFGEAVAEDFEDILVRSISIYLDNDIQKYAIFETFWEIGDSTSQIKEMDYILAQSRAYTFINGKDKNKQIPDYLKNSAAYPRIIFLVDFAQSTSPITTKAVLNTEDVEKIKDSIECITIGSFDNEGYLIWFKNHVLIN